MRNMTICFASAAILIIGCARGLNTQEKEMVNFINVFLEKYKPLEKEKNLAYWSAATTGDESEYKKYGDLDFKIKELFSNANDFAALKKIGNSRQVHDPLLLRQMDLLGFSYLQNQIPPELLEKISKLSAEVERKFSTHRATVDGKMMTDNEIKIILKTEKNPDIRKKAWEASKQVGQIVAADIIQLVKLRNQAAQSLGFDNFHTLSFGMNEQKVVEVDQIFNDLAQQTDAPFLQLKGELDQILAKDFKVNTNELQPWHYHDPFFQETPQVYNIDLDSFYSNSDVKVLASRFFASIGLPVESILEKSDLYEREGKNPHAFSTNIDREGDVRILCNLHNDEGWMETMLHELGHAVYEKYGDFNAPFLLRGPAHPFTTEGVAMFFGRLSRDSNWMQAMLNLPEEEKVKIESVEKKYARLKQLIFTRWSLVMYEFEKQLYANPDQDLNELWWQLVEKYQHIQKPAHRNLPDWAAKIHFTIVPCYYHNYLLGELFASQVHHYLLNNMSNSGVAENASLIGQPSIGRFFREKIFEPGNVYRWDKMITLATGEPLSAKYFVQQFVL
jgi:peptidyl-dipeptidase A